MIADELILKLQAELSDIKSGLKSVESDAEKTGKIAGEKLGKEAGKAFSNKIKADSNDAFKSIEGTATASGTKLSGVFGKIGAAVAGAFAIDKVITFFKSAVEEAEKAEEASGKIGSSASENFKKAQADIDGAIQKIKEIIGPTLLKIVRFIYDAAATILGSVAKVADAIADAFTIKNAEQIAASYQKVKKELLDMGSKIDELNSTNKRTAEQELELIKLKDQLADKAKKLGLNYNELAADAKNYLDIAEKIAKAERKKAKEEVGTLGKGLQEGLRDLETQKREALNAQAVAMQRGDRERQIAIRQQVAELNVSIKNQKDAIKATEKRFKNFDEKIPEEAKTVETIGGTEKGQESRFIDARLRLETIRENLEYTKRKTNQAYIARRIDDEERQRRHAMAEEEARQAVDYEINSLRTGYAQFIEDKYMADQAALEKSTDDAIRASNEILEAELKKAKDDEWAIAALKEENEERLQDIKEANARKQAQITLQSFADTASAANTTTTALASLGRSKDAGGALSGLGGVASGLSGFKNLAPALGALGPAGQVVGAVGGIVSTLSGLFGKSDEQRAREAAEQAQRDEEAKKILQAQAEYQRNMLALQEAAAKLPFENLQRNLRLIDIQTQQAKLSGVDAETADSQSLALKNKLIGQTLSEQAGAISQGQLFAGTGSKPDELIKFLNDRAAQAPAVAQFVALINSIKDFPAAVGFEVLSSQLPAYAGLVPPEIYKIGADLLNTWGGASFGFFGSTARTASTQISALGSEFTSDVARAENLLSVIQDQLGVQQNIADATKKTAENTSKALELRPDRERSFIDVGQGFIQSLGQRITSPSAIGIARSVSQNLTIPTELGAANVITGRARTLQERMADALETQIRQGATANDILRDIRAAAVELLAVMDGNPGTVAGMSMNDFVSLQSEANRRRV